MIVRSAILEGKVNPVDAARFDKFMIEEIVPLMKQFPGVRSVRVTRSIEVQDGGPPIYMVFESVYESLDQMHLAFTEPIRLALRSKLKEIMPLFDGRMFHIDQELLADDSVTRDSMPAN